MNARFLQHLTEQGSAWTRRHRPIALAATYPNVSHFEEDKVTKEMMARYGIDRVRGGSYVQINLPEEQKKAIQRELRAAQDLCFLCGSQTQHFAAECLRGLKKEGSQEGWLGSPATQQEQQRPTATQQRPTATQQRPTATQQALPATPHLPPRRTLTVEQAQTLRQPVSLRSTSPYGIGCAIATKPDVGDKVIDWIFTSIYWLVTTVLEVPKTHAELLKPPSTPSQSRETAAQTPRSECIPPPLPRTGTQTFASM